MRRPLAAVLSAAAVLPAALLFPGAAGAWSPDEIVTGLSGGGTIAGAAVALDDGGHATAIWGQAPDAHGPSYAIETANHTLGAFVAGDLPVWDGFTTLSGGGVVTNTYGTDSNGVSLMSVAQGAGGNAIATWQQGSPAQVMAAGRGTPATGWGAATSLSHSDGTSCPANINSPSTPALALDANGNGHIAFMGTCPNQSTINQLVVRPVGGGAIGAAPTTLSTNAASTEGGSRYATAIAERPGGGATVAYEHDLTGTGRGVYVQSFAPAASGIQSTEAHYVQQGPDTADNIRAAYLPDGRPLVVYRSNGLLYAAIGATAPVALATPGQSPLQLTLAVGGDGTAVLGWLDGNGGALWTSVRSPDGTAGAPNPGGFGPATQLSDDDGSPHALRLAVSGNGVGYAAWVRDTGLFDGIEAAILDPRDPDRSPGAPWTFQPVPDPIVNGGVDAGISAGPALPAALATDAHGDGIVVAPLMIDTGSPQRYALVSTEQASPRPADPAPGGDGGGGGSTSPAPSGGGGGGGGGGSAAPSTPATPVRVAPRPTLVVSGFNLTRNYFGAASREGRLLARAHEETVIGRETQQGLRSGTKIQFTLSQAATATITVAFDGCFDTRLSRRAGARTRHCTRRSRQGTVWTSTVRARKGRSSVTFTGTGLLRRQRLIPGATYDVSMTAIDPATRIAVRPRTLLLYARIDAPL